MNEAGVRGMRWSPPRGMEEGVSLSCPNMSTTAVGIAGSEQWWVAASYIDTHKVSRTPKQEGF